MLLCLRSGASEWCKVNGRDKIWASLFVYLYRVAVVQVKNKITRTAMIGDIRAPPKQRTVRQRIGAAFNSGVIIPCDEYMTLVRREARL